MTSLPRRELFVRAAGILPLGVLAGRDSPASPGPPGPHQARWLIGGHTFVMTFWPIE